MKSKRYLKRIGVVIAALIVLNAAAVIFYWNFSMSYSGNSTADSYDCGIVFFHGVTKMGSMSEDSKQRCELGAGLIKAGKVRYLICAGGSVSVKPGSKVMKDYIKSLGVPDTSIFTDTLSYSSITNIRESGKIIAQKNFKSVLLISSPTHMPRLEYLSRKYINNSKNGYTTFNYDYSISDIYLDCNSEFIKWVFLILLPESFTDIARKLIRS